MKKVSQKLTKGLFLLILCLPMLVRAGAINMDQDQTATQIGAITENTVIRGNRHKITGQINITTPNITVEFQNVVLDADQADILVNINAVGTSVTFTNTTFQLFTKDAIYAQALKSLTLTDCNIDAFYTKNIADYNGNIEKRRSGAGIDLDFGAGSTAFTVDSVSITNSSFINAKSSSTPSYAGAILAKVKDSSIATVGTITITGNTFTDNFSDVVIGTLFPKGTTTKSETGNIDLVLQNDGTNLKVTNYSATTPVKQAIDTTTEQDINFYDTNNSKKDSNNYVVADDNDKADALTALDSVKNDNTDAGVIFNYTNGQVKINQSDIKADTTNAISDFSFTVKATPTNTALSQYQSTNTLFLETTVSGTLPADKFIVTVPVDLDDGTVVTVKYYNETTSELETVATPTVANGNITFELTHYSAYVISTNTNNNGSSNNTTPASNTTTTEETVANPKTADNLPILLMISIVSLGVIGYFYYKYTKEN